MVEALNIGDIWVRYDGKEVTVIWASAREVHYKFLDEDDMIQMLNYGYFISLYRKKI